MSSSGQVAAVVYAAKSTADVRGSIPTQLADCRALAKQYGMTVVGDYSDEAASAFKGNRGDGLAQAREHAARERCALIVQHSDRLARGDGGQAQHLVQIVLWAREHGVRLVSVQDPQTFDGMGLVYAALMGDRNYEDSARKSKATRAGKQRQIERGEHLGGPLATGYAYDDAKAVTFDATRAPTVRRIFDLAGEGVPDAVIARRLNAEGIRTRASLPFDRRAIQNIVTNPFYAGRIAYKRGTPDERIVDGQHEALIEPADFDAIQGARQHRDLARGRHEAGRPVTNHALARLGVCGACGEKLMAVTSSYRRKDGSRARHYYCRNHRASTGLCHETFDAEIVDAAVVAGLDTLLLDVQAMRTRIEDSHGAERHKLTGEVERAASAHDTQAKTAEAVEAKWSSYVTDGDEAKADLVLPIMERERRKLTEAKRRLTAAEDALATIPDEAPADAILDLANALQDAIHGHLAAADTMAEVNQSLREMFSSFVVKRVDGFGPFDGILIEPFLRPGQIAPPTDLDVGWDWPKLIGPEPPPLRWLGPARNVHDAHGFCAFPAGVALPPIEVPAQPRRRRKAITAATAPGWGVPLTEPKKARR